MAHETESDVCLQSASLVALVMSGRALPRTPTKGDQPPARPWRAAFG